MGWLQAVLATLLAGLCEACPNDRPDIQCFRGAGIEGALLPGPTQNNKWVSATLEVRTDVVIRDLNLLLSVDHAANSDLIIKLQSPSGVTQTLAERSLRGSDLVQFILDDEAAKNFTVEGVAPYTGHFRTTEGTLSAWDGENARGVWKLNIFDYRGICCPWRHEQTGTLEQWELHVTPAPFCAPPRFQNAVADGAGGETSTCVASCPGTVVARARLSSGTREQTWPLNGPERYLFLQRVNIPMSIASAACATTIAESARGRRMTRFAQACAHARLRGLFSAY